MAEALTGRRQLDHGEDPGLPSRAVCAFMIICVLASIESVSTLLLRGVEGPIRRASRLNPVFSLALYGDRLHLATSLEDEGQLLPNRHQR